MKLYIITYKGSTTIKRCRDRYIELGYNPIIFMGKSIIDDNIPYNTVMYRNYTDLLNSLDKTEDILISEDDVYLNEKIEIKNSNKINWLGYWSHTEKQTLGCMLLYYPSNTLPHVARQFNGKMPQHADCFIYKYLDFVVRPTPITHEIPHNSIILEQYSKGKDTVRKHNYMFKG